MIDLLTLAIEAVNARWPSDHHAWASLVSVQQLPDDDPSRAYLRASLADVDLEVAFEPSPRHEEPVLLVFVRDMTSRDQRWSPYVIQLGCPTAGAC